MKRSQHNVQSYVYKKYAEINYSFLLDQRMKFISPYLTKKSKILELGCGEGLLSERIRQGFDADMYGIDISPSGITLAKNRGIHAQIADLNEDLPYKDSSFDMVISDQVLEHIFRTDHLLDEIYRVLKTGGIVITITPNLSFWLNRVLFLFGYYPVFLEASERSKMYGTKLLKRFINDSGSMGHIRIFNRVALEDILVSHNFQIHRTYGLPMSWGLPKTIKIFYDIIDKFFSFFPSLSRDLAVIAMKERT
jgi:ubiquinone/menaquinone biosynthesis C-methylase UbiE